MGEMGQCERQALRRQGRRYVGRRKGWGSDVLRCGLFRTQAMKHKGIGGHICCYCFQAHMGTLPGQPCVAGCSCHYHSLGCPPIRPRQILLPLPKSLTLGALLSLVRISWTDSTPGNGAKDAEAQQGHKYTFHGMYSFAVLTHMYREGAKTVPRLPA